MSTLTKIMRKPITSAIVAIFVGLLVASILLLQVMTLSARLRLLLAAW